MLDRFERPVKIICLAMAALLAWQLGSLVLSGDPLANLKIPALPTLPGATNEPAKPVQKETNAAMLKNTGTNAAIGTNASNGTNSANGTNTANGINAANSTNTAKGTNAVSSTNAMAQSTNTSVAGDPGQTNAGSGPASGGSRRSGPPEAMPGLPPGMTPEMMAGMPPEMAARMMAGGAPGGRRGAGMKKIELPPEAKARVDRILDSEIFGPIIRPMPLALIGISDQEAFLRATNGQTGPVKVGGQLGGIKLLRIGVNRVLVEQDGEKKELTLFGGIGGESLMPKPANAPSTNAPSTNAPARRASIRDAAASNSSTDKILSSKQKETQ
jgi:hypothetical protein